jgi:hypothetical protein
VTVKSSSVAIRSHAPSVSLVDVPCLRAMSLHPYSLCLRGLLTRSERRELHRAAGSPNWVLCPAPSANLKSEAMSTAASVCSMPRQSKLGTGSTLTSTSGATARLDEIMTMEDVLEILPIQATSSSCSIACSAGEPHRPAQLRRITVAYVGSGSSPQSPACAPPASAWHQTG